MLDPAALDPHWGWLIAGLILGIAEMIVPGVFLIWLGLAAVVTGLATLAFGLGVAAQFVVFAIAALASVYAGRRFLKDNPIETTDPLLNDRAARLIGQTVLVVDPIEGGEGRVKVGDGVWIARGPDTPPGARVRVTRAEGATLFVEPL
jgi:membrane protein implicated in regulation of membrane protease activity